jgi:photosystem II stability/assembly factor-like uncharacterized protein
MRVILLTLALLIAFPIPQTAVTDSHMLTSGIDTNLRGLSLDHAGNNLIVWATGSNGVILRSADAGENWIRLHIDNADTQDFRGIRSFGSDIAYVFSVGNDNKSQIYKTTDGGETWRVQYSDPRPAFFLDGLVCRTEIDCFAISDPIDGKFPILRTEDGEHWAELSKDREPAALPTEGIFAASNSSLILCGSRRKDILFATGGPAARVFRSHDDGHSWAVAKTPILSGNASAGIFSITCVGRTVVAVGGDYRNPTTTNSVAAYSKDSGVTWHLSDQPPAGYRSAVLATGPDTWVTVGTTGTDASFDAGVHWSPVSREPANVVVSIGPDLVIAAGTKGTINQMKIVKDLVP